MTIPQIKKIIEVGNKAKNWTDKICLTLSPASIYYCNKLVTRRPGISKIYSISMGFGFEIEVTNKFLKSMTRKEVIAFRKHCKEQIRQATILKYGYDPEEGCV
jgi:hypothetical protein